MASTIPKSVSVLIENPSAYMPAKVPMRDTGTAGGGNQSGPPTLKKEIHDEKDQDHGIPPRSATTSWIETSMNRVVS